MYRNFRKPDNKKQTKERILLKTNLQTLTKALEVYPATHSWHVYNSIKQKEFIQDSTLCLGLNTSLHFLTSMLFKTDTACNISSNDRGRGRGQIIPGNGRKKVQGPPVKAERWRVRKTDSSWPQEPSFCCQRSHTRREQQRPTKKKLPAPEQRTLHNAQTITSHMEKTTLSSYASSGGPVVISPVHFTPWHQFAELFPIDDFWLTNLHLLIYWDWFLFSTPSVSDDDIWVCISCCLAAFKLQKLKQWLRNRWRQEERDNKRHSNKPRQNYKTIESFQKSRRA